jgi:hypothetical protein
MFYGFTFDFQILAGQYSYYAVYPTDKSNIHLVSQFLFIYWECGKNIREVDETGWKCITGWLDDGWVYI